MITKRIGPLAEDVRRTLGRRGPLTLHDLCAVHSQASPVDVVMALGWLTHDDRVVLGSRCMHLTVMLRDECEPITTDPSDYSGGGEGNQP